MWSEPNDCMGGQTYHTVIDSLVELLPACHFTSGSYHKAVVLLVHRVLCICLYEIYDSIAS